MNSSVKRIHGDYYKADTVATAAEGRWLEIFTALAPELDHAIDKLNKHVPCPVHGGKDGFRLKKTSGDNGYSVCNTCGNNPTGFATLMWLKGWSFPDTLEYVAKYLGLKPDILEEQRFGNRKATNSLMPRFGESVTSPAQLKSVESSATPHNLPSKDPVDYSQLEDVPFDQQSYFKQVVDDRSVDEVSNTNADVRHSADVVPIYSATPERIAEVRQKQEAAAKSRAVSAEKKNEKIDQTWRESLSIQGGLYAPMRNYLKNRSVLLGRDAMTANDCLRFHPAHEYWEADDNDKYVLLGKHPAMIAAVRNTLTNELVTLHRTYLTRTGNKARVPCPRKMMGHGLDEFPSIAIQLGGMPLDGVLGVAEGLETALSPMAVYRIPTWSTVNASMLAKFEPPKGVHTLLVWADKDRSNGGQHAAQQLKERMIARGIRCKIVLPSFPIPKGAKSIDWNDVLINHGAMGFPHWQLVRDYINNR